MKEVKEALSGLTASVEKSTEEGRWVERATHRKKLIRVHNATAHPGHHSHWLYRKILCNARDATESEIFCPGYLSDLMVF